MTKIPVSFEHEGHKVTGTLDEVAGGGDGVWHLMVNKHYWGRLRKVNDEWYFDESKWPIGEMKDYFAAVVTAWYKGLA